MARQLRFPICFIVQEDEVEAVVANTKQILNQFLRKSRILCHMIIYLSDE